ncbi:MAG: hypothetical protein ACE5H0_13840, partial [Bacteroidota bacterium]
NIMAKDFDVSQAFDRGEDDSGVSATASQDAEDLKTLGTPGKDIEEGTGDETTTEPVASDKKEAAKSEDIKPTTEELLAAEKEKEAAEESKEEVGEELPDTFDIENITRRADNKLEFRMDPKDPKSTVYVGDTIDELLDNLRKGVAHKDEVIRKSRAGKSLEVPERVTSAPAEGAVEPPNEQAIYLDHLRRVGADLSKINWTREDWKRHQETEGLTDFDLFDERNKYEKTVERAQESAEKEITEKNVEYMNSEILDDETAAASAYLNKNGIEPDLINYQELLEDVYSDKSNFNELGVLRPGVISIRVVEAAQELVTQKNKTALQKKLDEDIARGKKLRAKIKSEQGGGETFTKPSHKAPRNVNESFELAKKAMRSKSL